MKLSIVALSLVALSSMSVACVSATVSAGACLDKDLGSACSEIQASGAIPSAVSCTTDPSVVASLGLPTSFALSNQSFSVSTSFDISNVISNIKDVASSESVQIDALTLTSAGDLSWVKSIDVQLSDNVSTTLHIASFARTTDAGSSTAVNSVSLTVPANSSASLLQVLKNSDTITLNMTADGTVSLADIEADMHVNVCVSVGGTVSKTL